MRDFWEKGGLRLDPSLLRFKFSRRLQMRWKLPLLEEGANLGARFDSRGTAFTSSPSIISCFGAETHHCAPCWKSPTRGAASAQVTHAADKLWPADWVPGGSGSSCPALWGHGSCGRPISLVENLVQSPSVLVQNKSNQISVSIHAEPRQ